MSTMPRSATTGILLDWRAASWLSNAVMVASSTNGRMMKPRGKCGSSIGILANLLCVLLLALSPAVLPFWWWPLTAKRQQSALYQPAIMRAGSYFLADITSFFKITSGQLIKASFEQQRAFRHQINGAFGNCLLDAACLPIFI